MPGTTSTALPCFSYDQHHETDAAKWKEGGGHGSGITVTTLTQWITIQIPLSPVGVTSSIRKDT